MQRYSRQIILPEFGDTVQQKLLQSKVLVIGAGGLGVPVLQYLSAAGVGEIGVMDGDILELTNLQRQVLYDETEIGKNKAVVAVEKLKKFNSEIKFNVFNFFLDQDHVFELVEKYDIIVDCTDNFATRYLVNDVCYWLNKYLVFTSIFQYEAQLSVFHYGENPFNLRDIFSDIPDKTSVPDCNEAGVVGVLAGIAGCFQANEVLKIITGIGDVISGKLQLFNAKDNSNIQIGLTKNKQAFLPTSKQDILDRNYDFSCESFFSIHNIKELERIMNLEKSCLIDVREFEELPKVTAFPCLEIPLGGLKQNLSELNNFEHWIFICQSGVRSRKAIQILNENRSNTTKIYQVENGFQIFES
ncbi:MULTISPECIES: HesA/MoeB/ThiF family protein [Sphingobacterium]|uniref:HesA/MoeB/ThiF family protein n=1 Tax=Sphingobacterium TaxID=28453 RepID=UPI0013DC8A7D|nr:MULTISPECIES: HesA/MoeB/ThiF family protein [unclassified Sphingobacterium]